jgi:hypothetical protein
VPIVPDDKDWTWVVRERCPQCGFDAAAVDRSRLPARIHQASAAWREVLRRPDPGTRPDDHTWSPLEYACHVRDVHRVYAGRVGWMLTEIDPHYENWDQDATAVDDDYASQDPMAVADEVMAAGRALGDLFAEVSGDDWNRAGRRSDGASFTVDSIARYYLHDIEHHVWDVTGQLPGS